VDSSRLLDLSPHTGPRWLAGVARLARPWRRIPRGSAVHLDRRSIGMTAPRVVPVPSGTVRSAGRRIQLPLEWDGPVAS
jgi:hypothetical protein